MGGLVPVFAAYGAVFILAGLLPFILAFHLDGIVQIVRGNGFKALIAAFVLSVVIAAAGYFVLVWASAQATVTPGTVASLNTVASYFLFFSVPLALIAFIARTVKLVRAGSRAQGSA
ncbi:hypothetical protein D6T64_15995 [Cryobacterium melibiosiphilum]|uniref:Uncharacterized protein n=1 Tax=Cryobacterium melibiosiphilum TaxID=995039 RepID=A0A3A5MDK0_9MICO|nr:hypothetical protein [Cryobacterium melibiosiphilum]RJT87245.1 hypothetical protein D6T64_15995 [Cryobacterium melibiosiphilum]